MSRDPIIKAEDGLLLDELPVEILLEIFTHLSLEDCLRLRFVCNKFNYIISDKFNENYIYKILYQNKYLNEYIRMSEKKIRSIDKDMSWPFLFKNQHKITEIINIIKKNEFGSQVVCGDIDILKSVASSRGPNDIYKDIIRLLFIDRDIESVKILFTVILSRKTLDVIYCNIILPYYKVFHESSYDYSKKDDGGLSLLDWAIILKQPANQVQKIILGLGNAEIFDRYERLCCFNHYQMAVIFNPDLLPYILKDRFIVATDLYREKKRIAEVMTLLDVAIINNSIKAIRYLIKKGAHLSETRYQKPYSSLYLALRCNNPKAFQLLQKNLGDRALDDLNMAMNNAIKAENIHHIEFLISQGVYVNHNHTNYKLNTLLHKAIATGRLVSADCLLANGANIHAANIKGETPFVMAYRSGFWDLFVKMIEININKNKPLTVNQKKFVTLSKEFRLAAIDSLNPDSSIQDRREDALIIKIYNKIKGDNSVVIDETDQQTICESEGLFHMYSGLRSGAGLFKPPIFNLPSSESEKCLIL